MGGTGAERVSLRAQGTAEDYSCETAQRRRSGSRISISRRKGVGFKCRSHSLPASAASAKRYRAAKNFLLLLPDDGAVAFEFRHPSWFDDEVFACLREHNCSLCTAEMDETESSHLVATATWGYVRLRRSEYSRADLLNWKERILSQQWDHAYIFFKHEDEGIGPKLAAEFIELVSTT